MKSTKWIYEALWVPKVKVIHDLGLIQYFQTSFPQRPLGRLKPNLMWSLLRMGEQKFVQMVQVTKMATMPIYGKTLKNILLWNLKANYLETWYAASGTRILPSL